MLYKTNNLSKLKLKKTYIKLGDTIEDALKSLSASNLRVCIVIDKKNFFKGILNDGDIRRALLSGNNLKSKIDKIYNKRPIIIKNKIIKKTLIDKLLKLDIDYAPIIKEKKVVDIFNVKKKIPIKFNAQVVIMCGGLGTRLKPLTKKIPKALIKIKNQPMLSLVIRKIKNYGFSDFILATNYKSNLIKNYYKKGELHNIKIRYTKEKKPLGTAGSLSLMKKMISQKNFLITNCDVISNINYTNLMEFHNKNKAFLTIAVKRFTAVNQFGEIHLNGINVKKIIEKPKKDMTINAGIYILSKKCLRYLKHNQHMDMTDLILMLIKKNKKIIAYPFFENWHDLGTKNDLKIYKKSAII